MVSPYLSKKKSETLEISSPTKKLFQVIYKEKQKKADGGSSNDGEAKIKVSDLISKISFFYEKIRNYVDYNEEHLHRKNAIARILKRQLVIDRMVVGGNNEDIARHLLTELIRAGYLPNNKIPESKIDDVANLLDKWLRLRKMAMPHGITGTVQKMVVKEKGELSSWIIGIAASEIEGILNTDKTSEIIVSNMYEYLLKVIKLPINFADYEKDLPLQIYISIYRTYLKYDDAMLSHIVFKYYNANWWLPKDEDIEKIAKNILPLQRAVKRQLEHPLIRQMDKLVGRYTLFYSIQADVISDDPVTVYQNAKNKPSSFSDLAKKAFLKKFERVKSKLWRAGINSVIYILLTKSVFAIALEVPANKYFGEPLNPLSLTINILFPPLLLFMVIMFTRMTTDENNKKVVAGVEEITFDEKARKDPIVLKKPSKRHPFMHFFFQFLYFLTFLFTFGVIVWMLDKINFTWVSIVIFLFFLVFVAFFALRIRRNIRALFVTEKRESLINFLLDFFFIPIAIVGRWLSERISKINVFMFLMDFVLEAPFKVLVEIAEQWTRYVRERKEDIE
jgi:hypothetical protein